jgi:hypothetical protein
MTEPRLPHGLSEGLMALGRATAFVPPEPGLVEMLVDTLVWVRKNYGGGSTTEINARIDAAIAKAIGPATGRRMTK